jgi:hypothetical protein
VRFLYRTADAKDSPPSIDRIDRTARNVGVCRYFLRSVLLWVIDRQGMITDRHYKYRPRIDRLEMSRFAALSPSFSSLRPVRAIHYGLSRCTAIPSTEDARGDRICYFGHK